MTPIFFSNQADFRQWLSENHFTETEVLVGFYKANSGKQNMSWSQSVDEALCFGWIDGVTHSIDKDTYYIRFTPRKINSIWSAVNLKKMDVLIQQGLMTPAGFAIFDKRKAHNSKIYTYEKEDVTLPAEFEKHFQENTLAWHYFQALAPSYRKLSINWVISAKQETTQWKRLNELMTDCETGTNKWKDNKYAKK
jgi:uncharacterized protein YdeI (YjbR/CyaY-like superfamily)